MKNIVKIAAGFIGLGLIAICLFVGAFMGDRSNSQDLPLVRQKIRNENKSSSSIQNPANQLELEHYGNERILIQHQIESFIELVLKGNQRIHFKEYFNSNNVGHLQIFNIKGLNNYYAYSDNRYPKNSQPTYYENFTLFILEYDNEESASSSLKNIYNNTNLSPDQMDSLRNENPILLRSIDGSLKPGGLICHRNNYIFSLVKTCRSPPIKNSWKEFEELFIKSISFDVQELNTLNAKCGMMNYKFEKRKSTDNNTEDDTRKAAAQSIEYLKVF